VYPKTPRTKTPGTKDT